jgi:hypothetical protein
LVWCREELGFEFTKSVLEFIDWNTPCDHFRE